MAKITRRNPDESTPQWRHIIQTEHEEKFKREKKEQQKIGIIMAIFAEELGDKKCIELLNKAEQYYNETFKTN